MSVEIIVGDALAELRKMPDESVNLVCTSPPYWGLRDYGIPPQTWGGDPKCLHSWGGVVPARKRSGGTQSSTLGEASGGHAISDEAQVRSIERSMHEGQNSAFCQHCSAWSGSLGLEPDYRMYVEHLVLIFREIWRVLHSSGSVYLNLGDCYATGAGLVGTRPGGGEQGDRWAGYLNGNGRGHRGQHLPKQSGKAAPRIAAMGPMTQPNRMPQPGLKAKDLAGMPWRVALALQDDGWWLREDIVWQKLNPMPESILDRCTRAHEFIFHLVKSGAPTCWRHRDHGWVWSEPAPDYLWRHRETGEERPTQQWPEDGWRRVNLWRGFDYYYEADAIAEPSITGDPRRPYTSEGAWQLDGRPVEQRHGGKLRASVKKGGFGGKTAETEKPAFRSIIETRNRRSVWPVSSESFPGAHFATMPTAIVEPALLAACPPHGVVLDPFFGAGTVGVVADRLGLDCIGIELSPSYAAMARRRIDAAHPERRQMEGDSRHSAVIGARPEPATIETPPLLAAMQEGGKP